MDGLIIGLDLCDSYTQISSMEDEQTFTIPTVICRRKQEDEWFVGEDAYGYALMGDGVIVDKLLKLVAREGTATIGGVKYEGLDLLKTYLKKVLEIPLAAYEKNEVASLVVTLQQINTRLMDALMYCADYLMIPRERVHVISHGESFIYYVLSQKRELWNNQVGMFDLSEESLHYYELKVQRGLRQTTVICECENLEQNFNLNILETPSGSRLADKILLSCGERLMQKKLFSTVFLTGKGFESTDWAKDFMKMLCVRRKVFMEPCLFSKGAAYKAADYLRSKTAYPYIFICDGRLDTTVSMKVIHQDKETQLVVAAAGDSWYESKSTMDLIMDNQNDVEFMIIPADPKKRKLVKIPLEGFPSRPNRTTRVTVSVGFLDENTMAVVLKDKGFGEIFPATDTMLRQEVML